MKSPLFGKTIIVYGLAKSGLSAIRLLQREGAKVVAVDRVSREALGETAVRLEREGVRLHLAQDPSRVLLEADGVVVSPGVPLALPELLAAREAGVPIMGEVELAARFIRGRFVGITGTNGKSTTTALCGALFQAAGRRTFVGGNLGSPLSEAALAAEPFEVHVVELSSFQLEGMESARVNAAAILNLQPDHIDRYADMAAYGAAKARIFRAQDLLPGAGDFAVVNADDAEVLNLSRSAKVPVYGFTLHPERVPEGTFTGIAIGTPSAPDRARPSEAGFRLELPQGPSESYRIQNRALRGRHNVQNAMAAVLLARLSGVSPEAAQRGLDGFAGLPHRIESVETVDGVEWVNDSKATNVDSSLVALDAFPGHLWLILGGKGKGAPYTPMVEASRGKVKGVLTLGQDAPTIEAAYAAVVPVFPCGTLEAAVAKARELARPGDVVLLSPACASYDQFRNFEHRGDAFKSLVRGLSR